MPAPATGESDIAPSDDRQSGYSGESWREPSEAELQAQVDAEIEARMDEIEAGIDAEVAAQVDAEIQAEIDAAVEAQIDAETDALLTEICAGDPTAPMC